MFVCSNSVCCWFHNPCHCSAQDPTMLFLAFIANSVLGKNFLDVISRMNR